MPCSDVPADARTLPPPARTGARDWLQIGRVRNVVWSPYTLAVPNLPPRLAGLRIVHLTDLHMTRVWMPGFDGLLARLQQNPPDLVLITGDFVDAKEDARPAIANVRRFVDALPSRLGVYGIVGNHDGDLLPTLVGDWPVRLLCNETVTLRNGDTAIDLIGLHGVEWADASPRAINAIPTRGTDTLRLVMAHFPHQVRLPPPGSADIVFAGHTHGGQICLPGGIPLVTHDPLPARFARGVHRLGDRWLVVGRGLGFSLLRVRTFCPSEAIEVTLVRAEEDNHDSPRPGLRGTSDAGV